MWIVTHDLGGSECFDPPSLSTQRGDAIARFLRRWNDIHPTWKAWRKAGARVWKCHVTVDKPKSVEVTEHTSDFHPSEVATAMEVAEHTSDFHPPEPATSMEVTERTSDFRKWKSSPPKGGGYIHASAPPQTDVGSKACPHSVMQKCSAFEKSEPKKIFRTITVREYIQILESYPPGGYVTIFQCPHTVLAAEVRL